MAGIKKEKLKVIKELLELQVHSHQSNGNHLYILIGVHVF
jgi:hypothetical protein